MSNYSIKIQKNTKRKQKILLRETRRSFDNVTEQRIEEFFNSSPLPSRPGRVCICFPPPRFEGTTIA
jgi:hypothetical protein